MTLVLKRGDLTPNLSITLTDDDEPVNLTSATDIRLIGTRRGVVVFDRSLSGSAQGVVTMPWQAGDTDDLGVILVEAEVMWPGDKPQTFPHDGFERVRISLDGG